MGTWIGHVGPGAGFLLIGLWHLFNHIRLHALLGPSRSYTSPAWFPAPRLRYLEPALIMAGSSLSMAMELVIGPEKHQPFDDDGTIPSNHLHNFEHASISLTFFIYAAFAITFDLIKGGGDNIGTTKMTQVLGAAAFGQQLLLFHLHSSDHMGVEGQYHYLLQIIVFVSLSTTIITVASPQSFVASFVRSASIAMQGVWFVIMGYALWTPSLIAKGCFMNMEDGHYVVRCRTDADLHRAKSLVNIQFSWCTAAFLVFSMLFFLLVDAVYHRRKAAGADIHQYNNINNNNKKKKIVADEVEEEEEAEQQLVDVDHDLEAAAAADGESEQKKLLEEKRSFIRMGRGFNSIQLER